MVRITHAQLVNILDYNPDTGVFTWKESRGGRKKGSAAGDIDAHGYRRISLFYRRYRAHRLAWFYVYEVWPIEVDHINHARSDNKLINLRAVKVGGNNKNMSRASNNISGVTGVYWNKEIKKWQAQIKIKGVLKFLGRFSDIQDAAAARKAANIKYGFHTNHGL